MPLIDGLIDGLMECAGSSLCASFSSIANMCLCFFFLFSYFRCLPMHFCILFFIIQVSAYAAKMHALVEEGARAKVGGWLVCQLVVS